MKLVLIIGFNLEKKIDELNSLILNTLILSQRKNSNQLIKLVLYREQLLDILSAWSVSMGAFWFNLCTAAFSLRIDTPTKTGLMLL
jgi:hypothetical protein